MTDKTDNARLWGGLTMGLVFALLGLSLGIVNGWPTTAVVLAIGGTLIALAQAVWIAARKRRRTHQTAGERIPDGMHGHSSTEEKCCCPCTESAAALSAGHGRRGHPIVRAQDPRG